MMPDHVTPLPRLGCGPDIPGKAPGWYIWWYANLPQPEASNGPSKPNRIKRLLQRDPCHTNHPLTSQKKELQVSGRSEGEGPVGGIKV